MRWCFFHLTSLGTSRSLTISLYTNILAFAFLKKISFLSKLELASHHSSNKNNLFNNLNFLHLLSFDCIYLQITRFGDSNYLFPLCHITWQLGSTTFMASFKWALTNASLFWSNHFLILLKPLIWHLCPFPSRWPHLLSYKENRRNQRETCSCFLVNTQYTKVLLSVSILYSFSVSK